MYHSTFLLSEVTIPGDSVSRSLNLLVQATMSEPVMTRLQSCCSSFCTSPLGQYSSIINAFRFSQTIELAIVRVSDLTWPFHDVRALSERVQTANFTLLPFGYAHILKIDSVYSNHCIREMIPPLPLKDLGLQLLKSLQVHSLRCLQRSPWLDGLAPLPIPLIPLTQI